MKKLLITLLCFFCLSTSLTGISAQDVHILLDETIEIGSDELALLEQDLDNIENEYSISIYFTFDKDLSEDEFTSYNEGLLKNGNTDNAVSFCMNESYYQIDALGSQQSLIEENVDAIWSAMCEGQSNYDVILNYYQMVVALINSETYTSEVPLIEEAGLVVDIAGLFDENEVINLTDKLNELSKRYDMDIVVVTTDTLNGMSPSAYADDFYDYNGYKEDGILFLLSMEERDWYVSTKGKGLTFNDYDIDYTFDKMSENLSQGAYYEAFVLFADKVDFFLSEAKEEKEYDYHNEVKTFGLQNVLISLAIAALCTAIVLFILYRQLKSVQTQRYARDYVVPGSFYLTGSSDLFITSRISKKPRPKDTDSSSGGSHSSFHTSSSGSSHGGHGGKF